MIAMYAGWCLAHIRRAERSRKLTAAEAALLVALQAFQAAQ